MLNRHRALVNNWPGESLALAKISQNHSAGTAIVFPTRPANRYPKVAFEPACADYCRFDQECYG